MGSGDEAEVRELWDDLAPGWRVQVGQEGDVVRRFASDPVLWAMLGDVRGLRVLDAGCGTGYLAGMLRARGAEVTGVDISSEMIAIARGDHPGIRFERDSISELATLEDGSFDAAVSNFVLMDAPDLEGAVGSLHRVLGPGGVAVVVFSHPCFPQGRRREADGGSTTTYTWEFPYFEESRRVDPPWAHFTREFIWFHRPLSSYWKAFRAAGFVVDDFEEPRLAPERRAEAAALDPKLDKLSRRPYAVAFKLRKAERR